MRKNISRTIVFIFTVSLLITGCAQPSGGSDNGSGLSSANPKITDYLKVLPAGTDGTAGTSATYVEFGVWQWSFPQNLYHLKGEFFYR